MIRPEPRAPDRNDLVHKLMPQDWQQSSNGQGEHWRDNVEDASILPSRLFRGAGRKTADEVKDLAQNMMREGATPGEIANATARFASEHETGMFQNPAQQWVFELSDKDARLRPEALEWMKEPISKEFGGSTGEMDLSRLYQHDTLYDYAPQIAKTKANLEQPHASSQSAVPGGSYYARDTPEAAGTPAGRFSVTGSPDTDPNDPLDPWGLLGLVVHEKEHGLQDIFNMPRGGNKDDPFMQAEFRTGMRPQAEKIRISMEMEREKFAKDYAQSLGGGEATDEALANGRKVWEEMKPDQRDMLAQAISIGGAPGQFGRAGMPMKKSTPAASYYGQYRSLAGEQSAFGQQDRMSWDTERRRAEPSFLAGGKDLSPAFQMVNWGSNQFEMPDPNWALWNTEWKK